jgi:hypothetical protein
MIESRIKSAALEFSRSRCIRPAALVQEAMQIGAAIALEHAVGKVKHEVKLRQRLNRIGLQDGGEKSGSLVIEESENKPLTNGVVG